MEAPLHSRRPSTRSSRAVAWALCLVMALGALLSVPLVSAANVTEGFESVGAFQSPTSTNNNIITATATQGTYNCVSSTAVASTGTRSLSGDDATNDANCYMTLGNSLPAGVFCGSSTYNFASFKFRMSALPAASVTQQFGFQYTAAAAPPASSSFTSATAGYESVYFAVTPGGSLGFNVFRGSGGSGSATLGNVVANTWYDINIQMNACAAGVSPFVSFTAYSNQIVTLGGGVGFGTATLTGAGQTFTTSLNKFTITDNQATLQTDNTIYFDDFVFGAPASGTPSVPASATASFTNLVAFDVDDSGATAIARTDAGDFVRTIGGASLTGAASDETDCGGAFGVYASVYHVAYVQCSAAADAEKLSIRSTTLGTPNKNTPSCNTGSYCLNDIPFEDTFVGVNDGVPGDQDNDVALIGLDEFPIDYSSVTGATGLAGVIDPDVVRMAFGFSDSEGRIGVWTYSFVNNAADAGAITSVAIGASGTNNIPTGMCAHRDPNGKTYIYGSIGDSNTRGFRVTFRQLGTLEGYALEPSLNSIFSGTSGSANAVGVACGDYGFAVRTQSQVSIYTRDDDGFSRDLPIVIPLTSGDSKTNSIAMSYDGNWVTFLDGSTARVVCARQGCDPDSLLNPGAEVAQSTIPSGTWRSIHITGNGTQVWMASSTTVQRFAVYPYTVGDDVVFNPPPDINDVDDIDSTPAPWEDASEGLDQVFGGGGGVLLALLFIFIFAGFGYELFNGKVIGAGIGAICGFVYGVFNSFIPPVLTFLIVVAAVAFIGVRFFGGGRGNSSGSEM